MKIPLQARMAAAFAGASAKDFAIGWTAGLLAWRTRDRDDDGLIVRGPAADRFPPGSVKLAAFDAAVTFMREIGK